MVRKELRLFGLANFKIKFMGEQDVLLDFESKEDMEVTTVYDLHGWHLSSSLGESVEGSCRGMEYSPF